jgi:hypothetical protein
METNQPPAVEQELPDDFLADVSDESFVAAISAARTGQDPPSDLGLSDPSSILDQAKDVQDKRDTPSPAAQEKKDSLPEKSKAEPLNFANLRKAREAAEQERDQLREERDALLQKAQEADLTKAEKAQLTQDLEAARKELTEKSEAITRVSARETPEYKKTYNLYQEGWKQINEIVNSEALQEAGVTISPTALLQNDKKALNSAIRALQESGDYASANDLQQTLSAMNVWKTDLHQIEQSSVAKAQAWKQNREVQVSQSLQRAQQELSQDVPYMDFKSSAFIALPTEQQEVIKQVHADAAIGVNQVLEVASDPARLTNLAYRNAVVVRAQAMELEGLKQALPAKDAEIAKLQKELAAYQKAAGSSMPNGSTSTSNRSSRPTNSEEEFEELMAALKSL